LLYSSWPPASVGGCNDSFSGDLAHREARFVEVIDIVIVDPLFRNYVSYERKPRAIRVRIFAEDRLVVDSSIKTRTELRSSSYEVCGPVYSDAWRVAFTQESIRHFSNTTYLRRKRSRIKVEDISYNTILFVRGQFLVMWSEIEFALYTSSSVLECRTRYIRSAQPFVHLI
jgi:hypothetical protein